MIDVEELKERVAQACRVMGRLELTHGTAGHVSARIPGTDRILIRARGPAEVGVRYTTASEIIEATLDGIPVARTGDGLEVPHEIFIHTELYRARTDVYAVVHLHPPTLVLWSISEEPLLPLYGAFDPWGAQIALRGVPRYQRSITIKTRELGQELAAVMGDREICLMRGHGITSANRSIEEAALVSVSLNELAMMNYRARLLGSCREIPVEDRASFEHGRLDLGAAPAAGQPSSRAAALWRYYLALTGSS